ncbi:unnamed protein product [Musa acuminata subsp. burmannicoides]
MLKLGGLSPVLLLLVSCIAYPLKPAMAGCEAKSCGRVTNISHPFWLRDPRQPPCGGLSLFELSCEDGLPILVSSYNSSYYLQDIFYGNKSFGLGTRISTMKAALFPITTYGWTSPVSSELAR